MVLSQEEINSDRPKMRMSFNSDKDKNDRVPFAAPVTNVFTIQLVVSIMKQCTICSVKDEILLFDGT